MRTPALYLLLSWVAILLWQIWQHQAETERHRTLFERTGHASLEMLDAGIRSMGRGRRQRPEFLGVVLAEAAAVPGVEGAWLSDSDGTVIAATGESRHVQAPATFSGTRWDETGLLIGRPAHVSACLNGEDEPRDRAAHLFLLLDRSVVDAEIASDLLLRVLVQVGAAIAAVGAFLLLRSRLKTRSLLTDLAVAKERSRRNQEWALLGAGLAHETKNPLAVVRGAAQQLAEAEAGSDKPNPAALIVDEVDHVVARINEFLRYSRPAEPKLEPVEVRTLLEEMRALLEPDLAARESRLEIDATAECIRADRGMLRQIVLNLLVNATRALSPGDRIRLGANPDGDTATITVEDEGQGIPAEEIGRVFEPYFTRASGGTGLGLAIVHRLVEAHGWRIEITSERGRGTRVQIQDIEMVNGKRDPHDPHR